MAATAAALIASVGRAVVFTRAGAPTDPVTQAGAQTPLTFTLTIAAFAMSPGKAAHIFGPGASAVQKKRLTVYAALAGAAATPQIGDAFTWAGDRYRVIAADALDPSGLGQPVFASLTAEV